ncbi:hypothetical protein EVAR_8121_1 [Eumeta japonica]|uniref:Uncharacterized protein n=1 Tax=Eumeta variegata TaxID=151549 RepID=A0A4C1TSU4_EUMVA|nr:hypothetical protein EVAR_8121_1 [Eumeta japonica]
MSKFNVRVSKLQHQRRFYTPCAVSIPLTAYLRSNVGPNSKSDAPRDHRAVNRYAGALRARAHVTRDGTAAGGGRHEECDWFWPHQHAAAYPPPVVLIRGKQYISLLPEIKFATLRNRQTFDTPSKTKPIELMTVDIDISVPPTTASVKGRRRTRRRRTTRHRFVSSSSGYALHAIPCESGAKLLYIIWRRCVRSLPFKIGNWVSFRFLNGIQSATIAGLSHLLVLFQHMNHVGRTQKIRTPVQCQRLSSIFQVGESLHRVDTVQRRGYRSPVMICDSREISVKSSYSAIRPVRARFYLFYRSVKSERFISHLSESVGHPRRVRNVSHTAADWLQHVKYHTLTEYGRELAASAVLFRRHHSTTLRRYVYVCKRSKVFECERPPMLRANKPRRSSAPAQKRRAGRDL